MLGSGHAISGATIWITGWSLTTIAGQTHPHADVLLIGTLVCAGAALLPDFDHPNSRLAHSGGTLTRNLAKAIGWTGARIHAATKLSADRPDLDGHRTFTHTTVFAALAGTLVNLISGINGLTGKLTAAVLVYVFTQLGYAAIRAAFPGRRKKVRVLGRRRWHKHTLFAAAASIGSFFAVPAGVWWLGVAVGVGCFTHLLGDVITASGCPILWPAPIPTTILRYDRTVRAKMPVRVWRTWYHVGTPQWMRFRVGSSTETKVTWAIVVLGIIAVAGLVYGIGWVPTQRT